MSRADMAAAGEDLAASWYVDHGYELLARNWRCRAGEIDLVVARHDVVVISEVKSRSTDFFGTPAMAVDAAKRRRLRRLAVLWLAANSSTRRSIRFDVVEVLFTEGEVSINVIEGAF